MAIFSKLFLVTICFFIGSSTENALAARARPPEHCCTTQPGNVSALSTAYAAATQARM